MCFTAYAHIDCGIWSSPLQWMCEFFLKISHSVLLLYGFFSHFEKWSSRICQRFLLRFATKWTSSMISFNLEFIIQFKHRFYAQPHIRYKYEKWSLVIFLPAASASSLISPPSGPSPLPATVRCFFSLGGGSAEVGACADGLRWSLSWARWGDGEERLRKRKEWGWGRRTIPQKAYSLPQPAGRRCVTNWLSCIDKGLRLSLLLFLSQATQRARQTTENTCISKS